MKIERKFLFLVLFLFFCRPGLAFLVVQLNLEQLTALAERVIVGKCLEVRSWRDRNGRPVQYVTFEVSETLKGKPESRVTFKQLLIDTEEESQGLSTTTAVSELPSYAEGEEAILFLSGASEIGLTAPVGLNQGKFTVQTAQGRKWVANGIGNRGLTVGLKKSGRLKAAKIPLSGQPLRYEEFVSLVKKLAD